MHCAAYYGHYTIIPLLLEYGVPTDILNVFKETAEEESATT
jgi:ankyrin repeat protein